MTWGTYYFFYECPQCGKKYRYELEEAPTRSLASARSAT